MLDAPDSRIVTVDEASKTLTLTLKCEPHSPTEVYRGLTKIAFAVLPQNEFQFFEEARKWLKVPLPQEQPQLTSLANCCNLGFCTSPFPQPLVRLWKRNSDTVAAPYMLCELIFANIILVYPVPLFVTRHTFTEQQILCSQT